MITAPIAPIADENDPRLAECQRLDLLMAQQWLFIVDGKQHKMLSRSELIAKARQTLDALKAACHALNPAWPHGYGAPDDVFAHDCVTAWEYAMKKLTA